MKKGKIIMNNMNPKVDFYFDKAEKWQKETERLRTIVLDCGLTEELKWGRSLLHVSESNIVFNTCV